MIECWKIPTTRDRHLNRLLLAYYQFWFDYCLKYKLFNQRGTNTSKATDNNSSGRPQKMI